jgi:parvulin-like peptidyl-prolyl isomerase
MTFRAKPVTRRKRRAPWDNDARQQLYVTIGFIALIVLALLILVGAVGASYYNEHWKAIAKASGTDISRDQWVDRQKVDAYRIVEQEDTIRTMVSSGQLDQQTASTEMQYLQQQASSLDTTALSELIDAAIQGKLARDRGISVTDADIDAQLVKEASSPEQRKISVVVVKPALDTGASTPTDAQKQTAKTQADAALVDLKAGKAFADVAKQYSTDSSKDNGGDYGYLTKSSSLDKAFLDALFALPINGTTDVVTGADGTYRIGRVVDIIPAKVDEKRTDRIKEAVSLSAYREAIRASLTQSKLRDAVIAEATTGNIEQVHAWEIRMQSDAASADPSVDQSEIMASHILYSPKNDPQGAAALDANDPAWTAAHDKAVVAVGKLRAITDPQARALEFATLAKAESDDKGSGAKGGDLGWFTRATMVQEFADAVFNGTHAKYDVLDPVKTQYGWHVIMYVDKRAPAADRMTAVQQQLAQPNADFAAIAKAQSDATNADKGGDMGWVARLQLDKQVEDVLFGLQAGQTSAVVTESDGLHIYRVSERASQPVTDAQRTTIESSAFSNWYQVQRAAAEVWEDPSISAGGSSGL